MISALKGYSETEPRPQMLQWLWKLLSTWRPVHVTFSLRKVFWAKRSLEAWTVLWFVISRKAFSTSLTGMRNIKEQVIFIFLLEKNNSAKCSDAVFFESVNPYIYILVWIKSINDSFHECQILVVLTPRFTEIQNSRISEYWK